MKRLLTVVTILVLGFLGWKYFMGSEGVQVGRKAPDIEATLLDGTNFKLSDLEGNYVLIDFWGSWCAPCRRENPSLVKLYKAFENKKSYRGEGFEMLSIALEKIDGQAERAIKRDNLYWTNHIISMSRIVLLSPFSQQYKVTSVPTKILINPDGKIMSINPNIGEIHKTLDKYLK